MSDLDAALAGRRVVILGGTGFIGSRLAVRAAAGGARVLACGRSGDLDPTALLAEHRDLIEASQRPVTLDTARVDLSLEAGGRSGALARALQGADIVCNLAGRSGQVASLEDPAIDLAINVGGAFAVLLTALEVAPQARVVFASSRVVYGRPTRVPAVVGDPLQPLSFYGTHKLAAEHYHTLFHLHHGLATTVLRLTNPYGPRRHGARPEYGIVNWFLEELLAGRPVTVFGDGRQVRDFVYLDDVVDAILLAATEPRAVGGIYNVGAGVGTPFIDMAEAARAAVVEQHGHAPLLRSAPWPEAAARVETGDFIADLQATTAALGWRPRTPLAAGLERSVRHYLRRAPQLAYEGESRA